jgi:hypothetical protein
MLTLIDRDELTPTGEIQFCDWVCLDQVTRSRLRQRRELPSQSRLTGALTCDVACRRSVSSAAVGRYYGLARQSAMRSIS